MNKSLSPRLAQINQSFPILDRVFALFLRDRKASYPLTMLKTVFNTVYKFPLRINSANNGTGLPDPPFLAPPVHALAAMSMCAHL